MRVLYGFIYLLFGLVYFPVFLMKSAQAEDRGALFRERLGILPESLKVWLSGQKVLWVHAVSVGEVFAARPLLERLLNEDPDRRIILTTVTPTGQRMARRLESDRLRAAYFPFEFRFCVRRFFDFFQPACLLLVETELWPNILLEAAARNIPAGIVNGRLSPRSARGYLALRWFFGPLLKCLSFVLAQTAEDAQRYRQIGVEDPKVHVMGNLKFDNVVLAVQDDLSQKRRLRDEWKFSEKDLILIAGSTHAPEEQILERVCRSLKGTFKDLKLLIAPRHIERAQSILAHFTRSGWKGCLVPRPEGAGDSHVLIVNQLGLLKDLYAMADVAYVGGSMASRGGQSPIEPAASRIAIVHGPQVINFEQIYRSLNEAGGACRVKSEEDLTACLKMLLADEAKRRQAGNRAARVIEDSQGATARHVDWLRRFWASEPTLVRG